MKTYDVNRSFIVCVALYAFTAVLWSFVRDPGDLGTADMFLLLVASGAIMYGMLMLHREDILDADCRVIVLKSEKDVIVIEIPGAISEETAMRLRNGVEATFPGRKCMVIGDGIQLKVVQEDVGK